MKRWEERAGQRKREEDGRIVYGRNNPEGDELIPGCLSLVLKVYLLIKAFRIHCDY